MAQYRVTYVLHSGTRIKGILVDVEDRQTAVDRVDKLMGWAEASTHGDDRAPASLIGNEHHGRHFALVPHLSVEYVLLDQED